MKTPIAIIAALPQEADAFMAGQGRLLSEAPFSLRLIEANGIIIATSGIGKVNVAAAAMMLIERHQPALLAMIGTCGRVSDIAGDTFWIGEAVQHDYGTVHPGRFAHYQGGEWPIGPEGHPPFTAITDPGCGLPHARIGSGDAFIACADHSGGLVERLGIDIVDMEVAAMAQIAARMKLPWCAIKSVTDDADGETEGAFLANLTAASRRAAQAMEQAIALLG